MKILTPESYQGYVTDQCKRSLKTDGETWVTEQSIQVVAGIIGAAEFGICHGARSGFEVDRLAELTGAEVIGTDICGQKHPQVITWDFHNIYRGKGHEWVGNVDFIYSNSLDHSFVPGFALRQWVRCLKPDGRLFIEWSPDHDGNPNPVDCFQASLERYEEMISEVVQLSGTEEVGDRRIIVGVKGLLWG